MKRLTKKDIEGAAKLLRSDIELFEKELETLPQGNLMLRPKNSNSIVVRNLNDNASPKHATLHFDNPGELKTIRDIQRRHCIKYTLPGLRKNLKYLEHCAKYMADTSWAHVSKNVRSAYIANGFVFNSLPRVKSPDYGSGNAAYGNSSSNGRSRGSGNEYAAHNTFDSIQSKSGIEPVAIIDNTSIYSDYLTEMIFSQVDDNYRQESRKFMVNDQLKVRSKSEFIIAAEFLRRDVRFRYEPAISFNGKLFHPDFIFILPDGRLAIWEHFGMMDDADYAQNSGEKIGMFMAMGFIPGETLFLSFENKDQPLNMEIINEIFQKIM